MHIVFNTRQIVMLKHDAMLVQVQVHDEEAEVPPANTMAANMTTGPGLGLDPVVNDRVPIVPRSATSPAPTHAAEPHHAENVSVLQVRIPIHCVQSSVVLFSALYNFKLSRPDVNRWDCHYLLSPLLLVISVSLSLLSIEQHCQCHLHIF